MVMTRLRHREMAEGGPSPPDLETQKNEINTLLKTQLKKGDVWYLIDNRWFKQWKRYVGFDNWDTGNVGEQSTHPGPIDNAPIFNDDVPGEIKEHLVDELDYVLVPTLAWNLLSSWYGVVSGQEPIARFVVEHGLFVKHCKVEVYLVEFQLCKNNDVDQTITKKFSKAATIDSIEQEMRKIFDIPEDKETRLWNRYTSSTYEMLTKKDNTVQDEGLYQGQLLVIEEKNDDGTWPRQVKGTNNTSSYGSLSASEGKHYSTSVMSTRLATQSGYHSGYGMYNYQEGLGDVQPGLCGLSNLGNTCFMNSALQCMSNCPPLTRYFLDDKYWNELNTENPLGMKGEIAKAYGDLIKHMWSGKYMYTSPRNFKMQVGKFAPAFSGYQQQDSQELMAFLLDGLHEDLNRIKKKPYIELRDGDNRPDEVVAREAWENYRKRNDSIIVDIFHGLLKSTLVCPECNKVSVTFDPFCYLTLPLPIKKERQIDVFFVAQNPAAKPLQYRLTVMKNGCIADLCTSLSKFTGVSPKKMLVTDVYNHRFHKIYEFDEALSAILDRDDIFVYELPQNQDEDNLVILPVYLRIWSDGQHDNKPSNQLFGQPLVVAVPRKGSTFATLYDVILHRMSRYVTTPEQCDDWLTEDESEDTDMNGEVEMSNGDDEESDTQVEDGIKDVDEGIGSQEELLNNKRDELAGKNRYMFSMEFVNSSGNTEVRPVMNDGSSVTFDNKAYLAIDWHPKAKEKFYNEKSAEEFLQHESYTNKPLQKKQVIQLNECLELFTATERLSVNDSWYCPECKKHQQATKKFDLWSLPQILVLCFKRFSYSRYVRDKIDTIVEFPIGELDMARYIISKNHGPLMYDLVAVSNHYGGLGGGHYTALAKNKDDHKWYNFDDGNVSQARKDTVVSKAAYVLFYMRRDPNSSTSSAGSFHAADIPAAIGNPNIQDSNYANAENEDCAMEH